MWDWVTLQGAGQTAWDWGGQIGLGGLLGWFLKRWIGSKDEAADRGRSRIAAARPYVVPSDGSFTGDQRAFLTLRNDGPGAAFDVRVEFTGSAAVARVPEIQVGRTRDSPEMRLGDSPFFRQEFHRPGEFVVKFRDMLGIEYEVALPVQQERRADGRMDPLPALGQHRFNERKIPKRRLREIGGS